MAKPSLKMHKLIRDKIYELNVVNAYLTIKVGSYFTMKTKVHIPFKTNVMSMVVVLVVIIMFLILAKLGHCFSE